MLVTLLAFVCKYLSDLRTRQLQQLAIIHDVRSRGHGDVFYTEPNEDQEWLWNRLGVPDACTIVAIGATADSLRLDDLQGVMLNEVERVRMLGKGVRDSWLRQIDSRKLSRIVLSNCEITDGGFAALTLNEKMRSVGVSQCPLTNASLRHISDQCSVIESLSLRGTLVDDAGMKFLRNVSVKALVLSDTAITDNGIESIAASQLEARVLCLDGTGITDAGVASLVAGCPKLELLQLNRCPSVTVACLDGLLSHPMLRRVELADTSIQYEDVGKLCGVRENGVVVSTRDSHSDWQGWLLFKRPSHAYSKSYLGGGMF